MRAGDLRHLVRFQRLVETLDSYGQKTLGWVDVLQTWAQVRPLSTREVLTSGTAETTAAITHIVVVRSHPLLANVIDVASWRIAFGDRLFDLDPPRNLDERGIELVISCREGSRGAD